MENLQASEARKNFSETINRVAYGNERIVLNRNGKQLAALISIEDLKRLEQLEDEIDVRDCQKVLKNSEIISYDDARKELGLS